MPRKPQQWYCTSGILNMANKRDFWNREYRRPTHLELSDEPAEDLIKFCRFLERDSGRALMNVTSRALDIGCGNGRNLLYLAHSFGMRGLGYDISSEAVAQATAQRAALGIAPERVEFQVRDLRSPIPLPDASCTIVLDMMASHILKKDERDALMYEVLRVLRPGGWLFFKTFLLDDDANAARMLRDHPGPEPGMYIHPEIGHAEYVATAATLRAQYEDFFTVRKLEKSYKHRRVDGSPWKRRTISLYLQKTT